MPHSYDNIGCKRNGILPSHIAGKKMYLERVICLNAHKTAVKKYPDDLLLPTDSEVHIQWMRYYPMDPGRKMANNEDNMANVVCWD